MLDEVKVFVAGSCEPCQEVKKFIEEGHCNIPNVNLIDVETEEGFKYILKMKLQKVPSAFRGSKECKLSIDGESLVIDCKNEFTEGKSS